MAKKLTSTIAKALAEKVRHELKQHTSKLSADLKAKVEASKEHKEYMKVQKQIEELHVKQRTLAESMQNKFSTKIAQINIYSSGNISVYDTNNASVEGIRDLILIEDYLSDGTETTEQLIDRMVAKLIKP